MNLELPRDTLLLREILFVIFTALNSREFRAGQNKSPFVPFALVCKTWNEVALGSLSQHLIQTTPSTALWSLRREPRISIVSNRLSLEAVCQDRLELEDFLLFLCRASDLETVQQLYKHLPSCPLRRAKTRRKTKDTFIQRAFLEKFINRVNFRGFTELYRIVTCPFLWSQQNLLRDRSPIDFSNCVSLYQAFQTYAQHKVTSRWDLAEQPAFLVSCGLIKVLPTAIIAKLAVLEAYIGGIYSNWILETILLDLKGYYASSRADLALPVLNLMANLKDRSGVSMLEKMMQHVLFYGILSESANFVRLLSALNLSVVDIPLTWIQVLNPAFLSSIPDASEGYSLSIIEEAVVQDRFGDYCPILVEWGMNKERFIRNVESIAQRLKGPLRRSFKLILEDVDYVLR